MFVKKTRTGSLIILTFQERVRANPCEPPESHHWAQAPQIKFNHLQMSISTRYFFQRFTSRKNWRGEGALSWKNGTIDGYGLLTIARAGFARGL